MDLVATCWLTAGDAAPQRGDERSPFPLRERVEAAARAGFRGFGLVHADLGPAVEQYGIAGMVSIFKDNGIEHIELEFLGDWWADGEARAASDMVRRDLLRAAEHLGARLIKVGVDIHDRAWDHNHWVEEFAILAEQARQVGSRIALEPMPFGNIRTVGEALRLVNEAGSDAGGLMVDIWHVARAQTPFAELAALPLHRIAGVEINDADATPIGTLWEDTINHRRFCGQGSFDLPAFITAMQTAGWRGPWGVEVISEELRRMPLDHAVSEAYRTAYDQFSRLAASAPPG